MKLFKLSLKERKGDLTMAKKANSLAHTKWMCKYHIVFTPKYRRKAIYNQYREDLGEILRRLCRYRGVEIIEEHLMIDHVHMLVMIPPKESISSFMGYLKGKSAMMMFDRHANLKYQYGNRHFWAEGYYVSTVGLNDHHQSVHQLLGPNTHLCAAGRRLLPPYGGLGVRGAISARHNRGRHHGAADEEILVQGRRDSVCNGAAAIPAADHEGFHQPYMG